MIRGMQFLYCFILPWFRKIALVAALMKNFGQSENPKKKWYRKTFAFAFKKYFWRCVKTVLSFLFVRISRLKDPISSKGKGIKSTT